MKKSKIVLRALVVAGVVSAVGMSDAVPGRGYLRKYLIGERPDSGAYVVYINAREKLEEFEDLNDYNLRHPEMSGKEGEPSRLIQDRQRRNRIEEGLLLERIRVDELKAQSGDEIRAFEKYSNTYFGLEVLAALTFAGSFVAVVCSFLPKREDLEEEGE